MKIKNIALLAGAAGILAACGGSTVVVPESIENQRVFFAFNSSEISDAAHEST